jgi:hypothetical protein
MPAGEGDADTLSREHPTRPAAHDRDLLATVPAPPLTRGGEHDEGGGAEAPRGVGGLHAWAHLH